ncbi:hypothetical protein ACN5LI_001840 [Cronobacter turicensis]
MMTHYLIHRAKSNAPPVSLPLAGRLTTIYEKAQIMATENNITQPTIRHDAHFIDEYPQAWCGVVLRDLLSGSLRSDNDFLALAPACSLLVAELLETHNTTARLALAGRLAYALRLLKEAIKGELTPEQIEELTADERPATSVTPGAFDPENGNLCDYCRVLTEILIARTVSEPEEKIIAGLLFELVNLLFENLTAPRFYRSPEGIRSVWDGEIFEA